MIRAGLRHIAIIILLSTSSWAQTSFSVEADTNRILIGEQIRLQIKAELTGSDSIQWPPLTDSLAAFEIIKKGSIKEEIRGEAKILKQEVWVTSFDSGYAFIPALSARAGDQILESQAIGVMVGMPEVEPQQDYYDIKEPLDPPVNWWLVAGLILALLVLGVAIYFLIKRLQKRRSTGKLPPEASMSPYEWAMAQLDVLKNDELWQQGEVKEYYSRLTDILRLYIEKEMGKPAMESTADEVIDIISELKPGDELMERCESLMMLSVGVKYARQTPGEKDHRESLVTLEHFLEAFKPEPEEKESDVSVSV